MPKLTKKQKEEIIKKYGKIPTKKEIFEGLKKSQERLVVSLAAAWEVAPDDPEARKELLRLMEKALKLRKKVYKEVIREEPPEVAESYRKLRHIIEEEALREEKS